MVEGQAPAQKPGDGTPLGDQTAKIVKKTFTPPPAQAEPIEPPIQTGFGPGADKQANDPRRPEVGQDDY